MYPRSTLAPVVLLVGCLAWPAAGYAQDRDVPEGLWVSEPTQAGVSAQLRIPRAEEGARISVQNSAVAIPCPLALAAFPAPALVNVPIPGNARDGRVSGTTLPAPTGSGPAGFEHNATLDLDLSMRTSPSDGHHPSLPGPNHWVGTIRQHIIRTAPPECAQAYDSGPVQLDLHCRSGPCTGPRVRYAGPSDRMLTVRSSGRFRLRGAQIDCTRPSVPCDVRARVTARGRSIGRLRLRVDAGEAARKLTVELSRHGMRYVQGRGPVRLRVVFRVTAGERNARSALAEWNLRYRGP